MKKLSTNDRLNLILNGPDEDEDSIERMRMKEQRARLRLRKATLYGSGARAKVPKVRKQKAQDNSPFAFADTKLLNKSFEQRETTSIIPGAHEEQFRRVQTQTVASLNDADRVFVKPTLLNPSIRVVDQPPWS